MTNMSTKITGTYIHGSVLKGCCVIAGILLLVSGSAQTGKVQ
jgi:hypothetical protein